MQSRMGTLPEEMPRGARRPGMLSRARGFLLVTHPLPTALYVVAVGLFAGVAALAAHRPIEPGRLALLLAGIACAEVSVGAANDVRDLALDSLSRPEKPIVRGLITRRQAAILALVAAAGVFLFMTPLGIFPLILCLLIEGLGLAYDFGLKGTAFSALLFAGWFPLIPLLSWAVFGQRQDFLPWLVPLAALLGVAMNVSNTLPDIDDDLASGVTGLPHLLGLRRSMAVAWGLPLVTLIVIWLLDFSRLVPAHLGAMLVATGAAVLSVGLAASLYLRRPGRAALRSGFLIEALGVVGLGAAWLTAVAF